MPEFLPEQPRYGRVFQTGASEYAVFATRQDGTIARLDGDLERERFFRLANNLTGAQDLGTRLLCKACMDGHALVQHASPPQEPHRAAGPCTVPGCACPMWEGSDCSCPAAWPAGTTPALCPACTARWGADGGHYDNSAGVPEPTD